LDFRRPRNSKHAITLIITCSGKGGGNGMNAAYERGMHYESGYFALVRALKWVYDGHVGLSARIQ